MTIEKNELAIASREEFFSPEQKKLILNSFLNGASEADAAVMLELARARKLNPFTGQIHFVQRWNAARGSMTLAAQVGIDGLRAMAERTGKYAGQDEPEFELDDAKRPVVCRVRVYRSDWQRPAVGVAYLSEFAQRKKDGGYTQMWAEKPRIMLAKCAEAIALRKAFPDDLSGVTTPDELPEVAAHMDQPVQASAALPAQNDRIKAAVARVAPKAEAVDAIFATEAPKTAAPPSPPPFALTAEPIPEPSAPKAEGVPIAVPVACIDFGKNTGKPVPELTDEEIQWYIDSCKSTIRDTKWKNKWPEKRRLLDALLNESEKRAGA